MTPDTANEIPGLQTFQVREAALLAPYAMHSIDSAGRRYAEPSHPYRSPFQRDRDRILHCSAFRRLSGKMQVFTGDMGDYHRTRLPHTHEVASIARTIARALQLNEDLVEALALFHDIGHPPFGHAGEDALHECLADHGGFSHNQYALTIAEELEVRYANFPGLNLSRELLDGQRVRANKENPSMQPLLEVQLVDAADSMAYDAHDTDDAVKLGLVRLEELAEVPLIRDTLNRINAKFTNLPPRVLRQAVVHDLIDHQVSDVFQNWGHYLRSAEFKCPLEARASSFRITPSPELLAQKGELERFLYDRVYRHTRLMRVRTEAQEKLKAMFRRYTGRLELLPKPFQARCQTVGPPRSVAEYLAGMTDRFCNDQYQRLFTRTGG